MHASLGTRLICSSAYHPQTDDQTERINQILEDMLRACALSYSAKWDACLPLAEFAYNNSYQESIQMAPFEALYRQKCRTPLNWSEEDEINFHGPDMVVEAEERVRFIQANLKIAQSRQRNYADQRRQPLVFQVGNHVYLRVSPLKGVQWFGVKENLAPRYIRPFLFIEQCRLVAYRLELPPHLSAVHNIFHVSQLKKCLRIPIEVIDMENLQLEPDLTYPEHPIKILDRKDRVTRHHARKSYKV